MSLLETAFIDLKALDDELMAKRARGERLSQVDNQALKDKVKAIHLATLPLSIEEIAEVFERYDFGLGLGHIEPSFEKINEAFAWLEARDGDSDDDF